MRQIYLVSLAVLTFSSGLLSCGDDSSSSPEPAKTSRTTVLKLDNYKTGDPYAPQAGLVAQEMGAVTLGGLENPCTLKSVSFLYAGGPAKSEREVRVIIYKDANGSILPGAELYNESKNIVSNNDKLVEIDMSAANIKFAAGEQFRLGIQITQGSTPTLTVDSDNSISEEFNWIRETNENWKRTSSLGTKGDWIIRATVEEDLTSQ